MQQEKGKKKRPLAEAVQEASGDINKIREEVRSSPAPKRARMLKARMNEQKMLDLLESYNSDSSTDEEFFIAYGKAALGYDIGLNRKFSSLNTSKQLNEAASYFNLKYCAYSAGEVLFAVPGDVSLCVERIRRNVTMVNEAACRMLIDCIMLAALDTLAATYVVPEKQIYGTATAISGKLNCRGKCDYYIAPAQGVFSDRDIVHKLQYGSLPLAHVPCVLMEAKKSILNNCHEQLLAECLVTNCRYGILTNGTDWTFVFIDSGVVYAADANIDRHGLATVVGFIHRFLQGKHLPTEGGEWPPTNPVSDVIPPMDTDDEDSTLLQVDESPLHDVESPSDRYLGVDMASVSSSSHPPTVKPAVQPIAKPPKPVAKSSKPVTKPSKPNTKPTPQLTSQLMPVPPAIFSAEPVLSAPTKKVSAKKVSAKKVSAKKNEPTAASPRVTRSMARAKTT